MQLRMLKDAERKSGTFVYSIVLNERWLLPHFLDHYRRLGTAFFVFYDDGSTDGTVEYLLDQPDCVVLAGAPEEGTRGRNWGAFQVMMMNAIPERFGNGAWSVVADADEFLILPPRFRSLDEVTAYLDHRGLRCALTPMIDFYPAKLSQRNFGDLPPLEGAPYFDARMSFVRLSPTMRPKLLEAGVRVRLLEMLQEKHPERFDALFPAGGYKPAWLLKVPLLKTGNGIKRVDPHHVDHVAPMGIQLCLAHFKFHPASDGMVEVALRNRNHVKDAIEYRFLKDAFELLGEESLIASRTVRYRSPDDVESAGLIWAD